MLWLLLFAIGWMFLLLIPRPRRWVPGECLKRRSQKEYDLVMRASNWSPEMFYLCEDGQYRNAKGQVAVRKTLSEMMEEYAND